MERASLTISFGKSLNPVRAIEVLFSRFWIEIMTKYINDVFLSNVLLRNKICQSVYKICRKTLSLCDRLMFQNVAYFLTHGKFC
jgi:hypothetical protein